MPHVKYSTLHSQPVTHYATPQLFNPSQSVSDSVYHTRVIQPFTVSQWLSIPHKTYSTKVCTSHLLSSHLLSICLLSLLCRVAVLGFTYLPLLTSSFPFQLFVPLTPTSACVFFSHSGTLVFASTAASGLPVIHLSPDNFARGMSMEEKTESSSSHLAYCVSMSDSSGRQGVALRESVVIDTGCASSGQTPVKRLRLADH